MTGKVFTFQLNGLCNLTQQIIVYAVIIFFITSFGSSVYCSGKVDWDIIRPGHSIPNLPKDTVFCNPRAPPKCRHEQLDFCIEDYEYPEYDIEVGRS